MLFWISNWKFWVSFLQLKQHVLMGFLHVVKTTNAILAMNLLTNNMYSRFGSYNFHDILK